MEGLVADLRGAFFVGTSETSSHLLVGVDLIDLVLEKFSFSL
jgi:hypothetical protein